MGLVVAHVLGPPTDDRDPGAEVELGDRVAFWRRAIPVAFQETVTESGTAQRFVVGP